MQSIATCSAKLLRPTLGRDLPMTGRCLQRPEKLQLARLSPHTAASKRRAADATPGGRPQYAAPRDEIAPPLAAAEKLLCPTVIDRAPGEIIPDKLTVYRVDFPLKAWRAGAARHAKIGFARQQATTALRGRRPSDPGGTGKTSFCMGLTGEKNCLCPRAWGNTSVSTHR